MLEGKLGNIGIFKGMFPEAIDEICGQPQIEWVRGYFYRNERFFYWKLSSGRWLYIAFWNYENKNEFVVGDWAFSDEPKLGSTTEIDKSTSGPHIFIKVKDNWLPFRKELPKEYLGQISRKDLYFIKKYMG